MWPTTGLCPKRWHEGGLDGRSTGGLGGRPPVLKPLSTKVFQKKTGGWEVKIIRYIPRPRPRPLKGWGVLLRRSPRPWEGEGLGVGLVLSFQLRRYCPCLSPRPQPRPLRGGEREERGGETGCEVRRVPSRRSPRPWEGEGVGEG